MHVFHPNSENDSMLHALGDWRVTTVDVESCLESWISSCSSQWQNAAAVATFSDSASANGMSVGAIDVTQRGMTGMTLPDDNQDPFLIDLIEKHKELFSLWFLST